MNFLKKYKKNIIYSAFVLVLIFLLFSFFNRNSDPQIFIVTNQSLGFSNIIIGGTVVAQNEVNLSFQASGRIAQVNYSSGDRVNRGDVIARLDSGSVSANLARAQADLLAEQARLEEIKYQETVTDSNVATRRAQLLREMQNAYTLAEDVVLNKTDRFFDNPRTFFPRIFSLFNSPLLRDEINRERVQIGRHLDEWRVFSNSLNINFTESDVVKVQENIRTIQKYLDLLSTAVNQFEPQEDIPSRNKASVDTYRANTSTARSTMNTALRAVIDQQETLRPTSSQVPFQEARIKSAQATIQSLQADLEKTVIRAPFAGLVTNQDAKVGMSTFSDQPLVTMISDSNFAIEGFLPEIYIAQIQMGTRARVTLSPYGASQIFEATITYIDPVASIQNGVASYKIQLTFDDNDDRIMAGMTGDIELITDESVSYYWIPEQAVINQGGESYVKIKSGSAVELRKIEIAERSVDEVKISSGLIVGDQIILENN